MVFPPRTNDRATQRRARGSIRRDRSPAIRGGTTGTAQSPHQVEHNVAPSAQVLKAFQAVQTILRTEEAPVGLEVDDCCDQVKLSAKE